MYYNRGIALKYEEEFLSALTSFSSASALDPTWSDPKHQTSHMIKYLQVKVKDRQQKVNEFTVNPVLGHSVIITVEGETEAQEVELHDIFPRHQ